MEDREYGEAIAKVTEVTNIPNNKVNQIVHGYFKGIVDIIEEPEGATIKMDYFGKLAFSQAWKDKVEQKVKKKNETLRD